MQMEVEVEMMVMVIIARASEQHPHSTYHGLWPVWAGLEQVSGELPHVWGWWVGGVLEDTGFVGDVVEVLIGGPRFGGGLRHRDPTLPSVPQQIRTALEPLEEGCSRGVGR